MRCQRLPWEQNVPPWSRLIAVNEHKLARINLIARADLYLVIQVKRLFLPISIRFKIFVNYSILYTFGLILLVLMQRGPIYLMHLVKTVQIWAVGQRGLVDLLQLIAYKLLILPDTTHSRSLSWINLSRARAHRCSGSMRVPMKLIWDVRRWFCVVINIHFFFIYFFKQAIFRARIIYF